MIVDTTAPSITSITSSAVNNNGFENETQYPVTFTFSENIKVAGNADEKFEINDITTTNGTITNLTATSGSVYTATFTPSADGACSIEVEANKYQDLAGNSNVEANGTNIFSFTHDTTASTRNHSKSS